MNINLFKMEFQRYRNSMLIWSSIIIFLIFIDMAFYRVVMKEGMIDNIQPFLNSEFLGPIMKGFGLDVNILKNILGFYVIRNTPLLLLLSGIFSVITAVSIFANEENEKTAEFLFTKPLSRSEIISGKILVCFTHIIILNTIAVMVGFLSLEIFKNQDYSRTTYFIHSIYSFLLSFAFASIGFTLASITKRGRNLFAISTGIVLITYFLDLISKTTASAEFLGWISPFRYVDTNVLVNNYSLKFENVLFYAGISFILTFISFRIYLKKDILN